MKIIGIIPARMGASRFPGKPLYDIFGRPMLDHVFQRAKKFAKWDHLAIATCDNEIEEWSIENNYNVIMTSNSHNRCLDRVAEAVTKLEEEVFDDDVIVCVQGDEPMLWPEMIESVVKSCTEDVNAPCSVLAVDIIDEKQYINEDIVKIVHDKNNNVLYTSRSPIPYCKTFSKSLGAKRVGGILAFRWEFLKIYTNMDESPLEIKESCDSNGICDNGFKQKIAAFKYIPYFSVDSKDDIVLVEQAIKKDKYWGTY